MIKPDFKKIIELINENPGRLFGLVYPYVLVIGVGIGIYYLGTMNNIARQKVPAVLPDTIKVSDLQVVEAKTIPPIDILKFSVPTPELLEKGKKVFSANCASCHGEDGTGTGPASVGLNPAPRNFTVNENWKNGSSLPGIYQTLQEGIQGSGMIAYDFIVPEERVALAHYIRSTFVVNPPSSTNEELIALDQLYNLSKGMDIPAQIPVKSAMKILDEQKSVEVKNISGLLEKIKMMSAESGNKIFLNVTSDPVKAITTLSNFKGWKTSEDSFVKSIVANLNQNGFKANVNNLSRSEWTSLYNFLNQVL